MSANGATRLGVDVGGTFTDLVFYDDASGEMRVGKVPTTPAAPEEGVLTATSELLTGDELESSAYFLHGTTVGLNSILTRTGAVVGLLCTRGFRDILEIRRGDRDEPYNLFWRPPAPFVPRRLRLAVTERMRADGTVHVPFDEEDVRAAAETFREEGVTAVAIAFLNAYANPEHELAAERALRDAGFEGEISLSHVVSGEYREYERTSTTVIDAFVRGRMSHYLARLADGLAAGRFGGTPLVTRSGGGAMTFEEAEQRPFETVTSGPVAGAEGGAELARVLGLSNVVTADVGGTSFDTCLILDGRLPLLYEGTIEGWPLQTSWVDVRSIGAGGGSIAYVDVGGLLRVGPRSAGADPGPASYGRGGTEPTVTDAAAILGMLAEGDLAGGVHLDVDAAREAYRPLAEALDLELEEVARGAIAIVNANMANAIREITVEQGEDPREATLMTFGGAGPLFGTLLARELEMPQIVVPPYAGNFSAWGLLGADLVQTASRTRILPLDEASIPPANETLGELFDSLAARTAGGGDGEREIRFDMRYVGQEHYLTVEIPADQGRIAADAAEIRRLFTAAYGRTFGHTMDGAVETVALRATLRRRLPRGAEARAVAASPDGRAHGDVEAYSFTRGERLPFAVALRSRLEPGETVEGPMIILEETATTYLDAGYRATVDDPTGALFIKEDT
jgi:N-methylhydantoinase A